MNVIFAFALGAFLAAVTCDYTHAASMDYCRPYAAKFTQAMINYIWNRAYTTCLNSDDDPTVPTRWPDAVGIVNGSPLDVSAIGNSPATDASESAIASEEEKKILPESEVRGSAKEENSSTKAAWRAQCASEYRSWDAKTETVKRKGHRARETCPCGAGVVCK